MASAFEAIGMFSDPQPAISIWVALRIKPHRHRWLHPEQKC